MADPVLDDSEFVSRRKRFWTAALTDPRYSANRIAVAEQDGSLIGTAIPDVSIFLLPNRCVLSRRRAVQVAQLNSALRKPDP